MDVLPKLKCYLLYDMSWVIFFCYVFVLHVCGIINYHSG